MSEGDDLLFFDTFAHANNEELNLDLVQFPKPVYLSQVRVVPLGAKVQANFPGGVRLGATNPSQFKLELFVNDLSKPGASAFETLGILDYNQNASIHFDCEKKVPTDGLVLRGWYTTVTLAVYGTISKGAIIPEQPVSKPVSEQPSTPVIADTPPADHPSTAVTPEEKPSTPAIPEQPAAQKLPEPVVLPPEEEKPEEDKLKDKEEQEKEKEKEKVIVETKKDRIVKDKPKETVREKEKKRDDKRRIDDKPRGRDADYRESESESHDSRDRDRERRKERDYRGRSREREYDKHRERSRSDRERSRESSRRLRTPPPKTIVLDKDEKDATVKCISPGETEAISDDDMPEVDSALIAQNVGSVETDANEEEVKPEPPEEKEAEAPPSTAEHTTDAEVETEREELEEILSDEDIVFEEEYPDDIDMSEFGDEIGKPFNPYSFEVHPLQFLSCPSASVAETLARKMKKGSQDHLKQGSEAFSKLDELLQFQTRGDKWVELMDQASDWLPTAMAFCLSQSGSRAGFEEKILDWLFDGLDFEKALSQSPPIYIVRHLKAGLKLSSQVSTTTESLVRTAVDRGIVAKILHLYNAPHMALSLRLMCLTSLDSLLSWPVAVERFLNSPLEVEKNGYAYLVALLGKPQPTRAKVALVALLKKLHFYESLQRIGSIARILAEAPVPSFKKSSFRRCSALSTESQDSSSQDSLVQQGSLESPMDPYMSELLACFTEVKKVYRNPQVLIGQYLRFLPVKSQFEIPAASDCTKSLFSYMKDLKFLQALTLFLTHPVMSSDQMLASIVLEFLQFFLQSQAGLLFLAGDPGTTGLILKAILHAPGTPTEENRPEDELHMEDLQTQNPGSAFCKLGSQMAHSLQVMRCLDALGAEIGPGLKDCETLRQLHSLAFSTAGKQALVNVVTMGDNVDPLFSLLASTDPAILNSAARGYAVEIVILVVKFSTNVDFYQKYGPLLAGVIEQDKESKLGSIGPWLELSTNPSCFTYDGIPALCEVVKHNIDNVEQFPAPLIVALRLLSNLSVSEDDYIVDEESYVELKYIYAIVQMFSSEMLSTLTGVLGKVCQTYEHPTLHAATLAGSKGSLLMAIVHPCLKLVRAILCHVIHCRDKDFRDLTAIPILLQTYILVSVIPQSSPGYFLVQECCSSIIATLLAFTQPVLQPEKGAGSSNLTSAEDAIARSLWTRMIQEILQLILKGPSSFVCGLQILSELLPLPLPILYNPKSNKPTDSDTQQVLNSRKLWSVHLHSLSPQIHEMISVFSCGGLQVSQLLRRVCVQIADLSPTTASVVSRSIIDALMKSLNSGPISAIGLKPEEKTEMQIPSSLTCAPVTARILHFFTSLVSHPPVKGSILQFCRDSQKADDKYVDVLQWLCVILNTSSRLPAHTQAQECVVSIFQTLLDPDICLLPPDAAEMEMYLSAALPCREQMQQMIVGLLDHLANADHSYSSLLPALRTLTLVTEQNYTFQVFQRVLEKKKNALRGLFSKLAAAFSKDSSDCLSTLSTALELLRLLGTPGTSLHSRNVRTLTMSIPALTAALQWNFSENEDSEASKHPLLALSGLLKHHSTEDESLEVLRDTLNTVLELLQGSKDSKVKNEVLDFNVPPPESLASQFNSRLVFAPMAVEDERLSSSYWLSSQWVEEAETEPENVRSDLLELSKTCLGDFDLMAELTKLCSSHVDTLIEVEKHPVSRSKVTVKIPNTPGTTPGETQPLHAIISTVKDKSNKPYVAPMRGRGFGRGGITTRNDPFRSRVPNTSRPPSMHVDDFVALENSSNPYSRTREGPVSTRGRGARARGFGADRTRYPARPAGRPPGPWEDYFPADERRFPASGRPWPGPKDRYAGPAPNAARNRHSRAFR